MQFFLFPRRRFTNREHRLIFGEGEPSGTEGSLPEKSIVDDLGEMEFDMNPYTENVPEGTVDEGGKNMRDRVNDRYGGRKQELSGKQFFNKLHNAVTHVLNGVIGRQQHSDAQLRAGIERARAQGKYRPDAPEARSTGSIEQDIGSEAFNQFIEQATFLIWRTPGMQHGLVKITSALEKAWNLVMDLIQVKGDLEPDHELLRSDYWSGEKFSSGVAAQGARIPGSYYGGLSRVSSAVLGAGSGRRLSPEIDRFKDLPSEEVQFKEVVPNLYKGKIKEQGKIFFKTDDLSFDRTQWTSLQPGDDKTGKPHIFQVFKEAGQLDDTGEPLPGQEAFSGLVYVYGDYDHPEKASVVYVDFEDTAIMLDTINNHALYNILVTVPGFFSAKQATQNKKLLDRFRRTNWKNRDAAFFSTPEIGRLQSEANNMKDIVETLKKAGITKSDIEGWMKTLDFSSPEAEEKWKALSKIVYNEITSSDQKKILWQRAFASLAPDFVSKQEKNEETTDVGKTRSKEWWSKYVLKWLEQSSGA